MSWPQASHMDCKYQEFPESPKCPLLSQSGLWFPHMGHFLRATFQNSPVGSQQGRRGSHRPESLLSLCTLLFSILASFLFLVLLGWVSGVPATPRLPLPVPNPFLQDLMVGPPITTLVGEIFVVIKPQTCLSFLIRALVTKLHSSVRLEFTSR